MSVIGQAYRQWDAFARQHYKLPGRVVLEKLETGESGGRKDAVSSAKARAWMQFTPGTRQAVLNFTRGKVDPWRSRAEAYDAAVLHLTGKLGHKPGLSGYNPGGGQQYVRYILDQPVGKVPPPPRGLRTPAVAQAPASGTGGNAQSPFSPGTQGSALAALVAAAAPRPAGPPVSAPPTPEFAAAAPLPTGYRPIQSSGPPAPPQSGVAEKLRQVAALTQLDVPKIAQGGNGQSAPTRPGSAPDHVRSLFERAAVIDREHLPYKWGGGHGPTPAKPGVPVDCSGAVSRLLGVNPRVSGQFAAFGRPGRGKNVTVYANEHHVLMEINGRFWGTSGTNPGGGAGWIPRSAISPQYLRNFTARHPKGM